MKRSVGLWIDHRKAVIGFVSDNSEEIKEIRSNVEKQLRRSENSRFKGTYESKRVPADDMREKEYMGHLNIYFDEVISCVRDAESVLIFGPGEAKGELKKRFIKKQPGSRIVSIETVDKMTDRQILAKIRQYFLK